MLTTCNSINLSGVKISLWDLLNEIQFRDLVIRGIWVKNTFMITVRNTIGWSVE